jgi:outer membrane autotransporter protein
VQTLGAGNVIFDAILSGSADGARKAFDVLSGEIHASVAGVLLDDSRYLRDAITGRLRQSYGGRDPLAGLAPTELIVGHMSETLEPPFALGYAVDKQPALKRVPTDAYAAWTQAIGAWGTIDSDGNAASLQQTQSGFFTGLDATVGGDWRVGIAGGYTQSWFDVSERGSKGASDDYHLSVYGGAQLGSLGVRLGAARTWHDLDIERSVAFPGFADATKAEYSAGTAQMFGEVGYGTAFDGTAFEPFASLAYVNLDTDHFTETGGAAALTGDNTFDATFTTLGLRTATIATSDSVQMTLRGTLGWRHAFGDVTPEATVAFVAGGAPFTIAGVSIAKDALLIEAGLDLDVARDVSLGVLYTGQLARDAQDNAMKGHFTWRF